MKNRCLLIILLLPITCFALPELSFKDLNPKNSRIEELVFINSLQESMLADKYRGTHEDQLPLRSAISALFGNDNYYLESKAFSGIKLSLQGKEVPEHFNFYKDLEIQKAIKNKLDQNDGKFYKLKAAIKLTKEIISDYFNNLNKEKLKNLYLDYHSASYQDWPEELVLSSYHQNIAKVHGDRLIVINELVPRGVDLNFYNLVDKELTLQVSSKFDFDEYIIPGYVPAKDIKGYEILDHHKNSVIGFYRYQVNNQNYVLIVDTNGLSCSYQSKVNQKVMGCINHADPVAFQREITVLEPIALIGVMKIKDRQKCNLPKVLKTYLKNHQSSKGQEFANQYLETIKSMKIKGLGVRICYGDL